MLVSLTSWKVRSVSCGTPGRVGKEETGVGGGREGKTTNNTQNKREGKRRGWMQELERNRRGG